MYHQGNFEILIQYLLHTHLAALMISLNASQVEIGKLCLKYHLDDIVEEDLEELEYSI